MLVPEEDESEVRGARNVFRDADWEGASTEIGAW
jgi:hypothetical protein